MNETSIDCDPDRLRRLLNEALDEASALAVHRHLEDCDHCREQLVHLACDDFDRDEISTFLIDDDLDQEVSTSPSDAEDARFGEERSAAVDAVLQHLTASDDPRMLGRFGGYEIVGVIGCGGMGVVLKGFEAALNRYVAIKVLAPHLAISGAAKRRFAREGQAAASVLHPNVVAIHRVAEERGLPYLVMPYLGQESLAKRLDDHGPLSVTSILRISMQIAEGLSAAHRQGLVHRDIKPANILLDKDVERIVITDFGLARTVDEASQTKTAVLAGTPQYMSPEQARGDAVDHRSDLFSVATVMYVMATGRAPFCSESAYAVLRRIIEERPTPISELNPSIEPWLCRLIEKLHAKSPQERIQSASETAELLRRCLTHQQDPATGLPTELTTPNNNARRLTHHFGLAAALVCLCVAVSIWRSPFIATVEPRDINTQQDARPSADDDAMPVNRDGMATRSTPPSPAETDWVEGQTSDLLELHRIATELEIDSLSEFNPPELELESAK